MRNVAAAAAAVLVLAGCGQPDPVKDEATFVGKADTAEGKAVLRSIATYRTAKAKEACKLITPHFLKTRYRDNLPDCLFVVGTAKRELPADAKVLSVKGSEARVEIKETTNILSNYVMKKDGGVWKVDAIVEAP